MQAMKNFRENINLYREHLGCPTGDALAAALGTSPGTLRCWLAGQRAVSLGGLDALGNHLRVPAHALIEKGAHLATRSLGPRENRSGEALAGNLRQIFILRTRVTWGEREALFFGQISTPALMSYLRNTGGRLPPLEKLDLMAECLGVEVHLLIKEDAFR